MGVNVNALVMKEHNTNLVRRTLKEMRTGTRAQIAEATGLSTVTVATILQHLEDERAVTEVGNVASMGGRPAQVFRFNPEHAHVLVLFMNEEAGQDVLHVGVTNLYGEVVHAEDAPLVDIGVRSFEPAIRRLLVEYPTIRAIGFGLPGVELNGRLLLADYHALAGMDYVAHYRERFGLPLIVENDVNAACVGYCRRNGIDSEAAILYLYFPQKYPPGGGICIDGRLYKGFSNFAGEVAGMPLGINWRDQTLYTSPGRFVEAAAKLIAAASMLLNPRSVVLYGAFLTDEHLHEIEQHCIANLPYDSIPRLLRAEDFTLDYQHGMVYETLALLEQPNLIAR